MLDLTNINASSFMDLLKQESANKLINAALIAHYQDGQMIHSRGDIKPGLSIVKTGAVHVGVYDLNGTYIISSTLGVGHSFGEFTMFTSLPRTHDVAASGATEIYQIPATKFLTLYAQDKAISGALLSASLIRSHLLLEMLDAVRRLPICPRTAKFLLIMMRLAGRSHNFKCRQSDLAQTLGVSRMSLSKALKQLALLGLIETGYGEIKVPKFEALAEWVAYIGDTSSLP